VTLLYDVKYIGDGVYAGYDGYQVWIYTDRDDGRSYIALEPDVLDALADYHHKRQNAGKEEDQ
jgi:GT2 family glycosyltransferase